MKLLHTLICTFLFCCLLTPATAGKRIGFIREKQAAIVVDAQSGKVLYARNAYAQRHPASLTKKMTLYLLFEALKKKQISLDTHFKVSSLAERQAPTKLGLRPGETISVDAIIKALVIKSANDAAVAFAEGLCGSVQAFAKKMNAKAKQLGMHHTNFRNPSGLPDPLQITTANDMIILARALYRDFPEYYHYFKIRHFVYRGLSHRNHNRMLGSVQGVDGIKTGFTCASGFNISTSVVRGNKRIFAVVMGGDSWRNRDKQAANLINIGFKKLVDGSIQATDTMDSKLAAGELEAGLLNVENDANENCESFGNEKSVVQESITDHLLEISKVDAAGEEAEEEELDSLELEDMKEIGTVSTVKKESIPPVKPKIQSISYKPKVAPVEKKKQPKTVMRGGQCLKQKEYVTPIVHQTPLNYTPAVMPANWVVPEETKKIINSTKIKNKPIKIIKTAKVKKGAKRYHPKRKNA